LCIIVPKRADGEVGNKGGWWSQAHISLSAQSCRAEYLLGEILGRGLNGIGVKTNILTV